MSETTFACSGVGALNPAAAVIPGQLDIERELGLSRLVEMFGAPSGF